MTDVAIVTTTINYPAETLRAYASVGKLVVVGDRKTPSETETLVRELDGIYLTPRDQERWKCSDTIGWNCIQRRNVGFLEAHQLGAEIVITIDDDNVPKHSKWREHHVSSLYVPVETAVVHSSGWFNPGSLLVPSIHARGFPYLPEDENAHYTRNATVAKVGVNCGLWLGDPDIDALQRIVRAPETTDLRSSSRTVIHSGTWSPINSQNTAWRRELLPLTLLPPHIGRWDDILGGYIAQWIMWRLGYVVAYGEPLVHQARNEHNLWTDLRKEIDGLEYTVPFCKDLAQFDATGDLLDDLIAIAGYLSDARAKYPRWPVHDVSSFIHAWVADWEGIL